MRTEEFAKRVESRMLEIKPFIVDSIAHRICATVGTVYIIGNGGSASNAEHAANDFIKVAGKRAVALTSISCLSAFANDMSFSEAFSAQLRVMMTPQDLLLAISVSGSSPNIVRAFDVAWKKDVPRLLMMGQRKKIHVYRAIQISTQCLYVDDEDFGVVETVHQAILHMIANKVKEIKDVDHGS